MTGTTKRPSDSELATMFRAAAITLRNPEDHDLRECLPDLLSDLDGAADALEASDGEPFEAKVERLWVLLGEFHRANLNEPYPVLTDELHAAVESLRAAGVEG